MRSEWSICENLDESGTDEAECHRRVAGVIRSLGVYSLSVLGSLYARTTFSYVW